MTSGFHRALVSHAADPEGRRRLRLRIPSLLGPLETAWTPPLLAGSEMPQAGETVWVTFENGNVERPLWVAAERDRTTVVQPTAPENPIVGDLWIDSDGGNVMYRWSGTEWTDITHAGVQEAIDLAATKIVTYVSLTAPANDPAGTLTVGDLWIDLSNGRALNRWNGSVWVNVADEAIAAAQADALEAMAAAGTAQAAADGKVTAFYQAGPPLVTDPDPPQEGDLWVDIDDNRSYIYLQESWVLIQGTDINQALQDAANAQSTADSKIVSYYQTTAPADSPVGTLTVGDIWFDTSTAGQNRPYRWNGSGWVAVRDQLAVEADTTANQAISDAAAASTLAQQAQSTADSKTTTFYQATAPTSLAAGDLWLRTTDDRLFRASVAGASSIVTTGDGWYEIQDAGIAQAISDAATAQTTADSKIVTYAQATAPTGMVAGDVGDLWIDTDENNRLYRWNGSAWVDIHDLVIDAAAQEGAPNLLNKPYTDFQYQQDWYSAANGNLQLSVGTIATRETIDWAGTQDVASRGLRLAGWSASTIYTQFRPSATPYNVRITPGETYIVSAYVRNNAAVAHTVTLRAWGSDNAALGSLSFSINPGASERLAFVTAAVPAGVTGLRVEINVNNTAADVTVAGVQVEPNLTTAASPAPSSFKPGPEIGDGGMIKTGSLQSTNYIAGVQGWKIDLSGDVEFGEGVFRGSIVGSTINIEDSSADPALDYAVNWSTSVSASPPDGWTRQWSGPNEPTSWTLQAESGGYRNLKYTGTAATTAYRNLLKLDALDNKDNVEIVVDIHRATIKQGVGAPPGSKAGVVFRGAGANLSKTGYIIEFASYSLEATESMRLSISKANGGAIVLMDEFIDNFQYHTGDHFRLKARIVGGVVLAKVWGHTSPEPLQWQVSYRDAAPLPAGWNALLARVGASNEAVQYRDDFVWRVLPPGQFNVDASGDMYAGGPTPETAPVSLSATGVFRLTDRGSVEYGPSTVTMFDANGVDEVWSIGLGAAGGLSYLYPEPALGLWHRHRIHLKADADDATEPAYISMHGRYVEPSGAVKNAAIYLGANEEVGSIFMRSRVEANRGIVVTAEPYDYNAEITIASTQPELQFYETDNDSRWWFHANGDSLYLLWNHGSGALWTTPHPMRVVPSGADIDRIEFGARLHWTGEVWNNLPFQSGWANYSGTGGYANAQYRKMPDGTIEVRGLVVSSSSNTIVGYLPVGYRPPARLMFATIGNGALARIDVTTGGAITLASGSSSSYLSLDPIRFYAG